MKEDADKLEREVDEQRTYVSETLDALEKRFSPGQIFDQVLSYTRSNSGDFSRNLVNTVKTNPVPTLLTATGLAWLMWGQNRAQASGGAYMSKASYGVDPAYQSTGNAKDGNGSALKDKAKDRMQRAGHSAHERADRTRQQLHHARDSMRYQAQRAGQGFDILKEQPLALGALGIALGALVGASLPQTRRENQMLGETRDQLADKAAEAAEDSYEKAREAGSRLKEDAKQEAQQAMHEPKSQSDSSPPKYS